MSGYFRVQHGIFEHPIIGAKKGEPFCRTAAWLWLIDQAVFRDTEVLVKGKGVILARGQLTASVRKMADSWGWSPAKVQRFLALIQQAEQIRCISDTGQMVVTICNYETYQLPVCIADTPKAENRYGDRYGSYMKEEGSREESDAYASPKNDGVPQGGDKRVRGTRISPDWRPSAEDRQVAAGLGVDPDTAFPEFLDYWLSEPNPKGRKVSWSRTFRNRCRQIAERRGASARWGERKNGPATSQPAADLIRGFAAAACGNGSAGGEALDPLLDGSGADRGEAGAGRGLDRRPLRIPPGSGQ
jgi:hypothetical protein